MTYRRTRMNVKRKKWAKLALEAFGVATGQTLKLDEEDMVMDLLADLRHYCAQRKLDYDVLANRALNTHFKLEAEGNEG